MRRIGGDIVLYALPELLLLLFVVNPTLFNGLNNDDIGMVAFIGPTFCNKPSDCLPRTLQAVVDIPETSFHSSLTEEELKKVYLKWYDFIFG